MNLPDTRRLDQAKPDKMALLLLLINLDALALGNISNCP